MEQIYKILEEIRPEFDFKKAMLYRRAFWIPLIS